MTVSTRAALLSLIVCASPPASAENRPISRASASTGPDGSPLSEEDYKELEAIQQAVMRFESANKEYRGVVSHVVRQEYEKKRHELQARYEVRIKAIEKDEKDRRIAAIEQFERFLNKYPNDKRWTPDVIFRLAELYFERSNEEYLSAVDAAQKAADAAAKDPNSSAAQPGPVTPDYTKTIDLYKRLITEFPNYRLLDGAEYLMGYCLGEMTKEAEAKQALLALACANKYKPLDPPPPQQPTRAKAGPFVDPYQDCKPVKADSRFAPEAWTRIGEFHFDYNELELAIAAYARVLEFKDSPYFDKALYKLAWSYYRADKYPEAIKRFDELVVYSDTKKSESGKEGSDLRQEAIQYLGISFSEKDWNGDGMDDYESPSPSSPMAVQVQQARTQSLTRVEDSYKGRDQEQHVHEIYQKLGDIYFDLTAYLNAVEVYKRLLEKWPLDADNPKVQDRIVAALERMRQFEQALEERGKFVKQFSKGTPWYNHNRDKPEALALAAELAEQAIVKYAVEHHKAAQALKKMALASSPPDESKLQLASHEYGLAADGYAKYLEQYPNSKNIYDYTFFYAESLYYAQKFAEAAEQYEKVRDSNLDNRYLEDAAFNAVKSNENLVDQQVKAGRLTIPPLPEVGKVAMPVQPIPVPDEIKKMQAAYDAFVKQVPKSARIATLAYKAAEVDFRHLNFAAARPRLQEIVDKYCSDPVSGEAGRAILASYTIENDLDQIVAWSEKLLQSQCGGGVAAASATGAGGKTTTATGIAITLNDAKFQQAQKLLDAKKYEEAAEAFVKVVDANPKNIGGNNAKALYNAAVAYENVNRAGAATKLYERIVNEYGSSEFVDDALFRTAVNYQRFFEFDKAVVSYQRLASDKKYRESKHRTDALYNAAVILENDQAYDQAARLFQEYSKGATVKPEDQSEAYFRSGMVYLKAKDATKTINTFRDYLRRFPTDGKRSIEARFRIAEAFEMRNDKSSAMGQYRQIAALGATVAAASEEAEFPAHAEFKLAEQELASSLEKMSLSADPKQFAKSYDKFREVVKRMQDQYNRVINYRRVTWTLAGFFRIGYSEELLSKNLASLLTAPCPAEIMKKFKQEGCDLYLQQLQQQIEPEVAKVDEDVVRRYRTTLDQAAKLGVSNEWTRLARARANAFKPDEFPMIKDEHVDLQLETP